MVNPAIAMGVKQLELPDPLAQYGKIAAIQQAQNQNALAQYQLGAAQRAEAAQNALSTAYQQAYNPQTGEVDANRLRQVLATGGFGSQIPAVEKGLLELQGLKLTQKKTAGEIKKQETDLVDARLKQARAFLDTIDPTDPNAPEMYRQWHRANHTDDVLGPLLASRGVTQEQSMARIEQAIQQGPQAFAQLINQSKLGTEKFMELNKPTTQVIDQGGQRQVIQLPGLGGKPTTVGAYADVPLPPDVAAQQIMFKRAGAPVTNLSVNTGRKFGETFATQIAERDANMLDAARQAPTLAADANRIIDLANNSSVFTGSLAQVKLNVARALGVAGADTNEVVANTEQLIAAAGQSTLNAIKGAGLGTGQGFTDKDLAFLRDIAGGKITFTKDTLSELARLQYKTAEKAAAAWGSRVKEIPKEALEGTGITAAPITLPPLSRPGAPPKSVGQIPGQAPAAKTVVRTGTLDGRKVVQYSDGTTGYAD